MNNGIHQTLATSLGNECRLFLTISWQLADLKCEQQSELNEWNEKNSSLLETLISKTFMSKKVED